MAAGPARAERCGADIRCPGRPAAGSGPTLTPRIGRRAKPSRGPGACKSLSLSPEPTCSPVTARATRTAPPRAGGDNCSRWAQPRAHEALEARAVGGSRAGAASAAQSARARLALTLIFTDFPSRWAEGFAASSSRSRAAAARGGLGVYSLRTPGLGRNGGVELSWASQARTEKDPPSRVLGPPPG